MIKLEYIFGHSSLLYRTNWICVIIVTIERNTILISNSASSIIESSAAPLTTLTKIIIILSELSAICAKVEEPPLRCRHHQYQHHHRGNNFIAMMDKRVYSSRGRHLDAGLMAPRLAHKWRHTFRFYSHENWRAINTNKCRWVCSIVLCGEDRCPDCYAGSHLWRSL